MGFFIDFYIEYLIRVMIRLLQRWNARSWTTVTAEVTGASYRAGGVGCAVAYIGYKYMINGQVCTGMNSVPLVFTGSAKDDVEHYSPQNERVIRVRPDRPESSLVREHDLYRLEHGFRMQTK